VSVAEWIERRRRAEMPDKWHEVETRAKIRAALNFASGDDLDRIAEAAGIERKEKT